MSWKSDRSLNRIGAHLEGMGEIAIEKLKREADLWSLLSETNCREIFGAHVYVDVSNFSALASNSTASDKDVARLVQAVHIYQREVARIVEGADLFDGVRVHFQGSRLHTLFYRPIDKTATLATSATLLQLVLQDFVDNVFNRTFTKLGNFRTAAAADIGNAVGTQNGVEGDRELLFLGGPANRAAKTLGNAGQNRVTKAIYDALPTDLKALCVETDDTEVYEIGTVSPAALDDLCALHGIAWNRDDSRQRLEDDKQQFPLTEIAIESAEVLIDLDLLGIRKNKRVFAASLFADLTGFTAYIERADTAAKQIEALRVLHAVRKEFCRVLTDDFDGVRIQYQGDRVQAIFHLPTDDAQAIARKALDAAVGIQSSMETTLKHWLPEANDLNVAVGVDHGLTLVSRLGTRGARDPICLGAAVQNGARLEEKVGGREVGISTAIFSQLPTEHQDLFTWRSKSRGYVALGLTADKLERAAEGRKMFTPGGGAYVRATAGVTTVCSQSTPGARAVVSSRPYCG